MAEQTLKQRIETILGGNQAQQAFRIREEVKDLIEQYQDDPNRQDALQRLYTQLSLVALMRLSNEELIALFENNAGYLMYAPESIDIIGNMKDHLSLEFFVEDRNEIRDAVISALQRCDDRITEQKIRLGQEEVAPTVGNWIKVYVAQIGNEQAGRVAVARFFSQNPNMQQLSLREQTAVKRLINFYEYLKVRSDSPEGIETDRLFQKLDGTMYKVSAGEIESLFTKQDLKEAREKFKAGDMRRFDYWKLLQYFPKDEIATEWREYEATRPEPSPVPSETVQERASSFFTKQQEKFGTHILEATSDNSLALVTATTQVIKQASNVEQVQNLVYSLGQSPELLSTVLKNQEVIAFLDAQASRLLDEKTQTLYHQSKVSPLAFQLLLQGLLEDKLRLPEEEAKWRAYEVCRSLPFELQDYKTVVSYDVRKDGLTYRYA